jgi:tripartite-type tricarboxylate transporter receptor subunit TctC
MRISTLRLAAAAAIFLLPDVASAADPVADFYKGKQLRVVVGFSAGGAYDVYARVVGRHMVRFIPGNPTVVVQNMPGAGSITAARYMLMEAPRDGTALATISKDAAFDQVVNGKGDEYDLAKLNWIGNPAEDNDVMETWGTSGIRTIDDAKTREVALGSTSATGAGALYPRLLNNIFGTKFKIIAGFPGASQLNLAMERGEIDGRASDSLVSIRATKPQYLTEKKVNILMQMGFVRSPDIPDVPLMVELGRNPAERKVFEMLSSNVRIGRPLLTTPEVPPARLAALVAAFDTTMKDPEFLREAAQAKLAVTPVSGRQVQEAVNNTVNAPKEIVDLVRAAADSEKAFNCADIAKDKSLCEGGGG